MSDWYYAADNEQKGPISESELRGQLASSKLPADTLVWADGMDNWLPANEVAALKQPAKVQPATAMAPASTVVSTPGANNPESTKPIDLANMMGKPESLEVSAEDIDQNRIFGILAYLGFFCFVPVIVAKESPFAKYHANQGLVLFLIEFAMIVFVAIITLIVYSVMPVAHIITALLQIIYLFPLVLSIMGIINAAAGKCVPLPVIGGIKILK